MSEIKLAASNIGWCSEDDAEILPYLSSLGFKGLEIAPTRIIASDPYSHKDEAQQYSLRMKEEFGFTICSMQSIWRGRSENIFDQLEASALIDYTNQAAAFAQAIDCGNLVFGCPKNRSMPKGCCSSEVHSFFSNLSDIALKYGTVIAIEANPAIYGTNFLNTTSEAHDLLLELPRRAGLGINLDLGTIIQNGEDIEEIVPMLPLINHIHISEPHLAPIVERPIHRQLRELLLEYGYKRYVSLEMATVSADEMKKSLDYIAGAFA